MYEIKFKYREGYCDLGFMGTEYCGQCHTDYADDLGCLNYDNGQDSNIKVIPFGDCIHAHFKYKYKGVTTKNYECEYVEDCYNPHLNCIGLTIEKKYYECGEVFIDGVKIFAEKEQTE